jgi:hypothetical protein
MSFYAFSEGGRVVLVGLSRDDLNGQTGTITEAATQKDAERANVRLDATGQVVAIRRTNLRASPDEERSSTPDRTLFDRAADLLREGNALDQWGDAQGALVMYEKCRACGRSIRDTGLARQVGIGCAPGSP